MEAENKNELNALIDDYFKELNLATQPIQTIDNMQISFRFNSEVQEPLNWSKIWHATYESKLSELLNKFLMDYYSEALKFPISIKDAAIKKQAYYTIKNFKDRNSDFTKTNLNISLTNVNIKSFSEQHLSPNLSLKRIVTNSFNTHYNEAYPVQDIEKPYVFVYGPSNKARLKDCIAMHLFVKLNKLPEVIYLSNYTVLVLDSLNQDVLVTQESLRSILPDIERELIKIINDPAYSFYNTQDEQSLKKIVEDFELSDYLNFRNIYVKQNSYNFAQPLENFSLCYNKSILESTIEFKENSHYFKTSMDSLILNSIALFLTHNKLENIVIIGYSKLGEYTKIDRLNYLQIVDKYMGYAPVKSSRKEDLALYRAVVVFDYLIQKGVDPISLNYMSKSLKDQGSNQSIVNFTFR